MKERKYELDIIRIISCFFVVVIHVASYGMEAMDPMSANWMVRNLATCMTKCAVPIFFMLSGILFMEKDIPLKELYKKYIFRIVVIWVVWSSFYAAIDYIAYWKKGEVSVSYFVVRVLEGHYHLWFLPALLMAYIFLPILQVLVKNCSAVQMRYLGVVILIGVIGRETGNAFFDGAGWNAIWEHMGVPGAVIGVIYFVVGYYLYKNGRRCSGWKYLLAYLFSVVIAAGINMFYGFSIGQHTSTASNYLGFWIFTSSITFFSFLLKEVSGYEPSVRASGMIRNISECTLGIYLIHTFFLEQVYRRVGFVQDDFSPVIAVILFSVVTFLISFVFTWCIRRLPGIGKWIA